MKNYLLFGPPGAGKGTQSKKLCEKFNLVHISTGDIIREEQAKGTKIGKLADQLIDKGNFLPDDIVIELVKTKIIENPKANGFLFDGFPRTVKQAKILDEFLHFRKTPIVGVIKLNVESHVLAERIVKRGQEHGRKDDTREVFMTRFNLYNQETLPILDYFKGRGKILDIDGDRNVDEVSNEIFNLIEA